MTDLPPGYGANNKFFMREMYEAALPRLRAKLKARGAVADPLAAIEAHERQQQEAKTNCPGDVTSIAVPPELHAAGEDGDPDPSKPAP